MEEGRGFSKAVYASVIASVLVILLIQPLLNSSWAVLLSMGETVSNSIYRNAALGHRNYLGVLFLLTLTSSGLGIFTGYYSSALSHFITFRRGNEEGFRKKMVLAPYSRTFKLFSFLAFFSFLIGLVYWSTVAYVDLQLNTSFQQRLAVLDPKITDQERKELIASWAQMGSRADYDAIRRNMESIAEMKGISLSPPLVK